MGERMELWAQTNSTDWTRRPLLLASSISGSALPMQGENQREDAPGSVVIEQDLAREALEEELGGLVVKAPAAHVDGLDLGRRGAADRLVIAVADHSVIAHHAPERGQREMVRDERL